MAPGQRWRYHDHNENKRERQGHWSNVIMETILMKLLWILLIIKKYMAREKTVFVQPLQIQHLANGLLVKSLHPGLPKHYLIPRAFLMQPQGSRIKEFYRHGQNFSNTVTLETSGEKGGIHLSLNNTDNMGIVPNNTL